MIALVTYIKLSAFEKEGIMGDVLYRDGTYRSLAGLADRSFWGTRYHVDGDQKKLAEEG